MYFSWHKKNGWLVDDDNVFRSFRPDETLVDGTTSQNVCYPIPISDGEQLNSKGISNIIITRQRVVTTYSSR